MKLPYGENAYIPPAKLIDYLLSETHPVGRWKARLLRTAGFDESNMDALRRELMRFARDQEVDEVILSPHGTKYIIEGTLTTPTGTPLRVRTVWIIDPAENPPRFITAYPV